MHMYYSKVQSGSQLIIYYIIYRYYTIYFIVYNLHKIVKCIFLDKIICYLVSTFSIAFAFNLMILRAPSHQSMYIQDELNLIHLPGLAHTLRLEAFLESAPWKYYLSASKCILASELSKYIVYQYHHGCNQEENAKSQI